MSLRRLLFPLLLIVLAGCSVISSLQPTATPTPTPLPPTPTPVPAAVVVNGEIIPLADYSASLQQLQAAEQQAGKVSTPEDQRKLVLDDLIAQTLLAQAAVKAGHKVDDTALQTRIDELSTRLGGQEKLADWIIRNGFGDDSFHSTLRRSMLAAWQRDQLLAAVPKTTEQVHARQILVLHEQTANDLYAQLQAGADFATLAYRYDPLTGGDLGWFPRGVLTQPAVEEAAFSLKPGEFSSVISTGFGYHLLQVIDKDPAHALSPEALSASQQKTLEAWIAEQTGSAAIQVQVP
jgi:peptidyl-prolyl cis-trans isomerase C